MSRMITNIPKIRFNNYSSEYDVEKLGKYAKYRRGSFPQPYGNKEWYDGEESAPFVQVFDVGDNLRLLDNTKSKISKKAQPMSVKARKGQVLVTLQGTIGRVAVMQYDAFIDRTILIFESFNKKTDSYYFANIIKLKFIEEARHAPGGIIKTITKEALSEFELNIPEYVEQNKVGAFISNIDELIDSENKKLQKLKDLKSAMLSKMFPKKGSKVPEISVDNRFDWKEYQLWELTIWDKNFNEVEKDKQPKVIKYPYVLADVFNDIEDNSGDVLLLSTGSYVGYTTKEKAGKNLCNGEVVAIPWGGVPNIKYHKGLFVTADNRLATSNNISILRNKFLYYYLQNNIQYLENIYRGASIKHPSMSDVLNMTVFIPDVNVQDKIICVLEKMDDLIKLQNEKNLKLNQIKKAFIDKMFV